MDRILYPSKTHVEASTMAITSGHWASEEETMVEYGQQCRVGALLREGHQSVLFLHVKIQREGGITKTKDNPYMRNWIG